MIPHIQNKFRISELYSSGFTSEYFAAKFDLCFLPSLQYICLHIDSLSVRLHSSFFLSFFTFCLPSLLAMIKIE
jgi:hypothetical protein